MTLLEGDELQRLWSLVADLSAQLSANRELCQSLQQQADELKGQALHAGTGYTLRRFNLDISKEKFESDLEKHNAQLVMENQTLAHENKQLNQLLREYEQTLESVMGKFRSFSHATQQHTLELTAHYESILSSRSHEEASSALREQTAFSGALSHLGSLVRLALRDVEGEVDTDEDEDEEGDVSRTDDPFEEEGYRVGSPSGVGPRRKKQQGYGSAPTADPKWYGTGGYTGKAGDPEAERADRALTRLTEEERLRFENDGLRQLLAISQEPPSQDSPGSSAGGLALSLGKPRGAILRARGVGAVPHTLVSFTGGAGGPPQLEEPVAMRNAQQGADASSEAPTSPEEAGGVAAAEATATSPITKSASPLAAPADLAGAAAVGGASLGALPELLTPLSLGARGPDGTQRRRPSVEEEDPLGAVAQLRDERLRKQAAEEGNMHGWGVDTEARPEQHEEENQEEDSSSTFYSNVAQLASENAAVEEKGEEEAVAEPVSEAAVESEASPPVPDDIEAKAPEAEIAEESVSEPAASPVDDANVEIEPGEDSSSSIAVDDAPSLSAAPEKSVIDDIKSEDEVKTEAVDEVEALEQVASGKAESSALEPLEKQDLGKAVEEEEQKGPVAEAKEEGVSVAKVEDESSEPVTTESAAVTDAVEDAD